MILSPKTSLYGTSQLRDIYGYALCEVASMYTLKLGLMMDCKSCRTRGWDRSCDCSCTLCFVSDVTPCGAADAADQEGGACEKDESSTTQS